MHVAYAEVALTAHVISTRPELSGSPGAASFLPVGLAVFVGAVVGTFAGAFPLKFAAQSLLLLFAKSRRLFVGHVGDGNGAFFIGERELIYIEAIEHHLLSG
jgi:hypothetical protein